MFCCHEDEDEDEATRNRLLVREHNLQATTFSQAAIKIRAAQPTPISGGSQYYDSTESDSEGDAPSAQDDDAVLTEYYSAEFKRVRAFVHNCIFHIIIMVLLGVGMEEMEESCLFS